MTLTFVPGEVNSSPYSLAQCVWKNHHIVAYGSGNNLIISTSNLEGNLNNVQTIYLDNDPVAVDINELNAWICISLKSDIYLYKLINEYLSKPKWEHALVIPGKMQAAEVLAGDEVNLSGGINCLQWAVSDNELLVALNTSLTLYHIYDEYGELKFYKRWCSKQPNPVMHVKITRNASKIVSRGEYDKIIKVWTRCSYGDTTSLFLMSYLDHPIGEFVTDFKWKQIHDEEMKKGTSMDSSMATIKNFGGLGFGLLDNDNDNDVLYTVTNKNILRIWASDTITGHNRIRKVKEISLDEDDGDGGFSNLVIVDNYNLSPLKDLANKMNSAAVSTTSGIFQNLYTALKSSNGLEIALVISQSGRVKIYSVVVQTNSVLVNRLDKVPIFFNENCFPVDTATNRFDLTHSKNCTVPNIESKEYVRRLHPINITEINKIGSRNISILIQDRIKSTIRVCYLSYERLLYPTSLNPTSGSTFIGSTLINKFSGHTKTIRKLRKSSASRFNSNILISILDFPENNYIWEPLKLRSGSRTTMTLTKRFQIDVLKGYYDSGEHSKHGIWDAVILNDIEELSVSARHHLVATIEKTGNISLWDCNGLTMDDKAAELIARQRLEDNEGHYIYKCPRIFLSMEVTTPKQKQYKQRSWCIIAVFEKDLIRSWKVTTSEGGKGTSIVPIDVKSLPLEGDIQQIEVMDLILNPSTPSLFSVIDSEGKLRTFSMNKSTLEWIETCFLHTNVKNASKIHGVSLIHKVAIVNESGTKLSIWDTKNGVLEYEETFENEKIRDLDWTFIDFNKHERSTLSNAILLVGFLRHQLLYTQLRYDYTNNIPSFAVLKKLISRIIHHTKLEI